MRLTEHAEADLMTTATTTLTDLTRASQRIDTVYARVRSDIAHPVRVQRFDGSRAGGTVDPTAEQAIRWQPDPIAAKATEWHALWRELGRLAYRLRQLTDDLAGLTPTIAAELVTREHEQTGRCIDCGRIVARTRTDPIVAGRCSACYKAHQRARRANPSQGTAGTSEARKRPPRGLTEDVSSIHPHPKTTRL